MQTLYLQVNGAQRAPPLTAMLTAPPAPAARFAKESHVDLVVHQGLSHTRRTRVPSRDPGWSLTPAHSSHRVPPPSPLTPAPGVAGGCLWELISSNQAACALAGAQRSEHRPPPGRGGCGSWSRACAGLQAPPRPGHAPAGAASPCVSPPAPALPGSKNQWKTYVGGNLDTIRGGEGACTTSCEDLKTHPVRRASLCLPSAPPRDA